MSAHLTNEEIRQKLLKFNYDCGPVTDTTREIYIKKLISVTKKLAATNAAKNAEMTDEELRTRLISLGEIVAPITSVNRKTYLRRLEVLQQSRENVTVYDDDFNEWEPMDID